MKEPWIVGPKPNWKFRAGFAVALILIVNLLWWSTGVGIHRGPSAFTYTLANLLATLLALTCPIGDKP